MPTMRREKVTTAAQLLVFDDPPWRHELVRGRLRTMTPGGMGHGAIVGALSGLLWTHLRTRRLGKLYVGDTGFVLTRDPDTVLAPDLAFVRLERAPGGGAEGFFEGPPDLAVEVRSPRDSRRAVARKAHAWLAHGCACVWLVDPRHRTVRVVTPHGEHELGAGDTLHGEPLVPGFVVPVAEIFAG